MTFTDALTAAFKDNDRITRTSWRDRTNYFFVHDATLCTSYNSDKQVVDGAPHPVFISESDYFAEDWEVVTDG